ncbi:alpha-2-macroglobulin family protein [Neolewinella litorea]|nr:alpha-2-macroglobulin family protein [Neolewinella litorea]
MQYLLILLLSLLTGSLMAQDPDDTYRRIDALIEQGKYRSALQLADELYAGTEGADHRARALDYRATLTRQLEEDGEAAAVNLLRNALRDTTAPPALATVTHLLLGEFYHRYAESNAYRLSELTTVGEGAVPDTLPLADYGLDQLLYLSQRHLYRALELARANQTPLSAIPALITGGESRRREVPTLYDLIVDRAMEVLGSSLGTVTDESIARPELALLPAEAFVEQDLSLNFNLSKGTPRKLQLYQQWIAYHLDAGGPALLHADLERMKFAHRNGAPDSLYLTALQGMYDNYPGVVERDRILVEMARVLDRDDEQLGPRPRVRALALLDRVGEADPVARVEAQQLRAGITTPVLGARALTFYPRKQHLLVGLIYRNVARVHYRVYAYDPAAGERNSYRGDERLAQVMKGRQVASGSQRLPENDDYSQHRTELDLDPLPAGGYRMVIADDDRFSARSSNFSVISFQVTDLAVVRVEGTDGAYVQVADRSTGAAIENVRVTVREQQRNGNYVQVATRQSDAKGTFTLPAADRYRSYQLILAHPATSDRLVTEEYAYNNLQAPARENFFTTLLTDRAIYRPGQTVHVYGLRYRTGTDELPVIVPGATVSVVLRDANYQEVAQREATADAYGRFSLDFALPTGGLTGDFSLQTENGNAEFRVEEYKRPRFTVELETPPAVEPGATATVTGTALTYAGPPVAEARVNYRVYLEEVRWFFSYFRGGGGGGDRELLVSGTTDTDAGGDFTFTFETRGDLNTDGFRRYRYVVEADVADATGETHQATTTVAVRGQRPAVAVTPQRETVDRGDSLQLLVTTDAADTSLELQVRIVPVTKPNAALIDREWEAPDRPVINRAAFERHHPHLAYGPVPELSEWPTTGPAVYNAAVTLAGAERRMALRADFPVGHYRIEFTYPDGTEGVPATFSVYSSAAAEMPSGVLYLLHGAPDTVSVGEPVQLQLISALDLPLVLYQWQGRTTTIPDRASGERSIRFTYTPTEADRGGLAFELGFVRLNRMHRVGRQLALPWENKEITVTYATFRDRLRPGFPEQWTLTLRNADGSPVEAAALATMYDASLDQIYAGRGWDFAPYPRFYGGAALIGGGSFGSDWGWSFTAPRSLGTDTIPALPRLRLSGDRLQEVVVTGMGRAARFRGNVEAMAMEAPEEEVLMDAEKSIVANQVSAPPPPPTPGEASEEEQDPPVNLRTNLRETAFWLPQLTAGTDGSLQISFTSPEALTAWKFRLFAHDRELRYVISEREIVTQKELMVLPNVPRFFREGDSLGLTARVSNLTDRELPVTVRLELFDPATDKALSVADFGASAGAVDLTQEATLAGQGSATVRFPLKVPEGLSEQGLLGYRITARGGDFSDGEENVVPVLTDRTLVSVTVPFYLKRNERKTVSLPLLADYDSETLRHVGYTFQVTTNPTWLALKALPYLMEYPYDGTEQVVNRYFANQLAYATVANKPVLEQVFRRWQADSTALLGELQRNESLTQALLTETPWVREAESETEQRARLAHLFDLKKLAREQEATLAKLAARQESDGAYSWFPGGPSDRYMTQYVVETLAQMRQLGVVAKSQSTTVERITQQALVYLDAQLTDDYRRLLADQDSVNVRKSYRPSALQVHHLYARAQFGAAATEAVEFFRARALDRWTDYGLYEQALIALIGKAGDSPVAPAIVESLRERALHSDEFGMYWKYPSGYQWNNLPIETHTRLLEAFRTIDPRPEELDEMRLWLLSNKRTNRWSTTKATAAAVLALLNTGVEYQVDDQTLPVEATWPGIPGDGPGTRVLALQETAEVGTGEITLRLSSEEVNRDLATVKVRNRGNDLVWGGVFWQYTERADRVESSSGGALSLERQLFRRAGDRLIPLTEDAPLKPGDRVTVRLTVRSDRDLDYVHVKDRRAATFEPVTALSGYTYQGGLGYYFAPGDLATNFFIDHLPRGTYTLEYDLFTTYAGNFSNGLGRVECMYAPEFGGNSEGGRVLVW